MTEFWAVEELGPWARSKHMKSNLLNVVVASVFLLVVLLKLSGCGDTEHVPNPFELAPDEMPTEKIFVAGSGPSSSNPDEVVGLVTVITHGGRDDLAVTTPLETALLGEATVATGGHVYVSNPEAGSVTALFAATDALEGVVRVGIRPGSIAVDPSGQFIFVTNQGATGDARPDSVSVIDANPSTTTFLQEIAQIQVEDGASDLAFSTRRNRAFVSNRLAGTVSVIDTDSANVTSFLSTTASIPVGPSPGVMAYSPDSGHVYVIISFPTAGDSIAIVDADSLGAPNLVSGVPRGNAAGELPQADFLKASRNGDFIWVSFSSQTSSGGGIAVIDTATDTVVSRLDLAGFSPSRFVEGDDSMLFVSGGEGTNSIVLIDASTPFALREVSRIAVGTAAVNRSLTLSLDRTRVYVPNSGEESGTVSVIDTATTSVIATIPTESAHPNAIVSIDAAGLDAPAGDTSADQGHDHG